MRADPSPFPHCGLNGAALPSTLEDETMLRERAWVRQGCAVDLLERRRMLAAHVAGSSTIFATIQAAVNAAPDGGVVTVDAGTYHERVSVTKSLTIRGAKWGVDARSNLRRGGGETVVDGAASGSYRTTAFYINADDVTIEGFTVQG